MRTLFDLDEGHQFKWQGSVYKLIDAKAEPFIVTCVARQDARGNLYHVNGHRENFNPYAEVEPGQMQIEWQTA